MKSINSFSNPAQTQSNKLMKQDKDTTHLMAMKQNKC